MWRQRRTFTITVELSGEKVLLSARNYLKGGNTRTHHVLRRQAFINLRVFGGEKTLLNCSCWTRLFLPVLSLLLFPRSPSRSSVFSLSVFSLLFLGIPEKIKQKLEIETFKQLSISSSSSSNESSNSSSSSSSSRNNNSSNNGNNSSNENSSSSSRNNKT